MVNRSSWVAAMKHRGDTYGSFAELKATEAPGSFAVMLLERDCPVVVVAPHGGKIEPGTSELAVAIAQDDLSLYCFEGRKPQGNRDLHITSARFDEPQGLALMQKAQRVLTVHGEGSEAEFVRVGGLDEARVTALRAALRDAEFEVDPPVNASLEGRDRRNICNIGRSGAGVQLEISLGLRKALLSRDGSAQARAKARKDTFCRLVRAVLTG